MQPAIHGSGLELVNAVVNVPDCMIVSFPSFSLTLLKRIISASSVCMKPLPDKRHGLEMGLIATSYTEHQSHDPMYQFWGRMCCLWFYPKEAVSAALSSVLTKNIADTNGNKEVLFT